MFNLDSLLFVTCSSGQLSSHNHCLDYTYSCLFFLFIFFFSKQEILKQAARGSSGDNKRWEDKTTEISFKVFA